MNNKVFLLTGLVIVGLAAGFYNWLGGFNKPEITEVTSSQLFLAGKEYRGSVKSEALGTLYQEMGKVVESKTLTGDLGGIYYNNPEEQNDSIRAFVGVVVPSADTKLPEGFEMRSVPAGQKAIRVQMNVHYMLAPGKLYPAAFEYAKDKKLETREFFVERYRDTHSADYLIFLK